MNALTAPTRIGDYEPAWILARAAELREDAIKDKTYQATPIGSLVGRYLRQLAFDRYAPKTIENREQVLARHALDLAHKQPGEITLEDLREHVGQWYAHLKPNTHATALSHIRAFYAWAHDNDHIPLDPARKLRGPRLPDTEKRDQPEQVIRRLIMACDLRRDRLGLLLMYWCGLRRNELRVMQWRHIDLANRTVRVFGKGSRILDQNIPEPLAMELERFVRDENPRPNHFVMYPTKVGRRGKWPLYLVEVTWEDRGRSLSTSGIDQWWRRAVKRAGLDHFTMHEMRHSAGTHFHRTGHDLVATQHFMRHKNPTTTAKVYIHLDRVRDVARVQRDMIDPMEEE